MQKWEEIPEDEKAFQLRLMEVLPICLGWFRWKFVVVVGAAQPNPTVWVKPFCFVVVLLSWWRFVVVFLQVPTSGSSKVIVGMFCFFSKKWMLEEQLG